MPATIIDGRQAAAELRAEVAEGVAAFRAHHGRGPGLVGVQVGADPASEIYQAGKAKAAEEAGMVSRRVVLPEETTQAELDALIDELTVDAYGDEEQLSGFRVGAEEALRRGERARLVGADVEVMAVDCGPDVRTGLLARVHRDGTLYDVALADLTLADDSELGLVVAAYRRWQGR